MMTVAQPLFLTDVLERMHLDEIPTNPVASIE
jgi:hypothetical protein